MLNKVLKGKLPHSSAAFLVIFTKSFLWNVMLKKSEFLGKSRNSFVSVDYD